MDKDAALLIVAKDLFIEGMKLKTIKVPANKAGNVTDYIADEFIAFIKKLQSGLIS